MTIYDHSPNIPMRDGWAVSVSGHAISACRFKITNVKTGGVASIIYDPLGKMSDNRIPTWEIYPINGDAASIRLDENLMPYIEKAMEHSLLPNDGGADWDFEE